MSHGDILNLVEEIATTVLEATPRDESALIDLTSLVKKLSELLDDTDEISAQALDECLSHVLAVLSGESPEPDAELESAASAVTVVQKRLAESPPGSASASSDLSRSRQTETAPDARAFVLPEFTDESIFREFLDQQEYVIEEIEADILSLEAGDAEAETRLKRRLHTMKGEAGILGLDPLEQVCHGVEEFLEAPSPRDKQIESLLAFKDWVAQFVDASARFERPPISATVLLERINEPHLNAPEHDSSDRDAEAPLATACDNEHASPGHDAAPVGNTAVEAVHAVTPAVDCVARDEETLELTGDFLQEANDGIGTADGILLAAEEAGANKESLDALFRVFHTIKGVAGFLNLKATASLAHATETLLNHAREERLALQGPVLDLVLDATQMMRELLDAVREACERGNEIEPNATLQGLIDKIEKAGSGILPEQPPLPSVPVEMKIGEVLTGTLGVPESAVDNALAHQKATGKPLGKQLVDDGAANPKQVAQALRAQSKARVKIRETVKIDLGRVDNLVAMIGELVIVESMVANDPEVAAIANHRVRKHLSQLGSIARELQDVGMRMRMVPVRGVFQKMARMVHDLSRKGGKEINLELIGEGVEMDRSMVEQISDPLVHMIRNAVDHGIEPADEREAAGKAPTGQLRLSAYHEGGSIVIELQDDGRGLDRDTILAKALASGLVREGDRLSDSDVYNLIFSAGLSTAEKVTEISGRGVGMDVVRRNIEAMRGRVGISSSPGKGTRFKMVLPLTLAIIDGMVVACGAEQFIIPTLSIIESLQPTPGMLSAIAGCNELINLRGKPLPLLRLSRVLGLSGAKQNPVDALVVIVESNGRRMGLLVDDVVTRQQVVIKSLSGWLVTTPCVAGAAILADGNVGLILNVDVLSRPPQDPESQRHSAEKTPAVGEVVTEAAIA